ncbi:hypothetical protein PRK78_000339 [Emydomyces testavorans]|uniref:E3 ubiquitin-protein ligase listerin n=1 Tax=Emydomyces testavorans TaxID=2070801 RepID=A0AAF0IFH7_9EURO|nr:hypothetical protein PRK78_000339 [Emydomyces testavorans]
MSKKFKSQASSSRAASGAFGAGSFGAFSQTNAEQGGVPSTISYIFEPPDLSLLSQPQVVVAFKNLSKKDSTTKSKALEDLLDFVCDLDIQEGQLENGFLEAWAKVYPRVSIDISRKVRQLAHVLQGYVVSTTGRRIARYIPRVIGAWLAGLYDNDKLVIRAAQESVIRAFPTEEKRQTIWKIYQSAIIEFVVDAVVQQTPLTLSDERTVRPDEADAKHARVAATALQMLTRLLARTSARHLEKDSHLFQTLFGSRSLWQLAHHEDSFVRRSLYELCQISITAACGYLEWKTISAQVLSKSLSVDQHGSASEFSSLLLNLTKARSEVWSSDYSGKTASSKRLLQYIKKGSQGASSSFWRNLQVLLQIIPVEVLFPQPQDASTKLQVASSVMEAFLEGISSKEEPRSNLSAAWSSYIETSLWISGKMGEVDCQLSFIQSYIFPILEHYVMSPLDQSRWTVHHKDAVHICAECLVLVAKVVEEDVICQFWTKLSEALCDAIKLSAPEQAQNYKASQDAICLQSSRFFGLEAGVLHKADGLDACSSILKVFHDTTLNLFHTSLQVLKSRKGEPYGASSIIKEALANVPQLITDTNSLDTFLTEGIPGLVSSPYSHNLVSTLFTCRHKKVFQSAFPKVINAFRETTSVPNTLPALQVLFSSVNAEDFSLHPQLESLVMESLEHALHGDKQAWTNVSVVLHNPARHNGTSNHILNRLLESLSVDDKVLEALHGLTDIVDLEPVKTFITGAEGSKLISKLLFLSESPNDDIAHLADALQVNVSKLMKGKVGFKPTVEIIQNSFENVGEESLSVDALVTIAQEILKTTNEQAGPNLSNLFPSEKQWAAALQPFLEIPPPPSLSIMSPLGGAVFFVERSNRKDQVSSLSHDSNQLVLASRLALYVTKLLSTIEIDGLDSQSRKTLFLYLPLVTQLIDDDINIEGSISILPFDDPESRNAFVELVSGSRHNMKRWISTSIGANSPSNDEESTNFVAFWQRYLEQIQGNAPDAYRLADVYARVMSEREAVGTVDFAESSLELAQKLDSPSNPLVMAAVVTAFKTTLATAPAAFKMCNQLVAQATGLDELSEAEGLQKLVTLNALMQGDGNFVERIATQRLVFFVKHLMERLQSEELSLRRVTEIFKALTTVFPQLKEIYGSHWVDIFAVLKSLWESSKGSDEYLPALHASLRLFACLRGLATGENNDDLEDAWVAVQKGHVEVLIGLLSEFDPSFYPDMPWSITIDLLDRQIKQISVDHIKDVSELFATLSINSRGVQRAVYDVLRRVIPKLQESLSFNVALSDTVANLPDELVSLLLEAPSARILSQLPIHEDVWMSIRCYLLSWKVVFDHFAFASLPVQERYSENIIEISCLDPLLDFMFDFLQSSQGKLVDASRFNIRSFELDESESPEKETQWLLTHVYYLCLRYLPKLTKDWWLNSKNRVKGPVEAWTQKYISPLVMEDALRNVGEWFTSQDWTNEEQALQVKVSYKAAEIVASIEIDEDSPSTSITISLPPTYPLQQAVVTGGCRVAVDEKKWKSWLMAIQGVIMFSNGSLIDGLRAFRKNVQGALKGQGECAICYSVISTNMQTPNKKCATCKNTFHSDCLFRWFKSSNSSSCPLCRNNFLYS